MGNEYSTEEVEVEKPCCSQKYRVVYVVLFPTGLLFVSAVNCFDPDLSNSYVHD